LFSKPEWKRGDFLMTTIYYKLVGLAGEALYGKGTWDLPKNGRPGKPWRVRGPLEYYKNGIHAVRREHLVKWLGPRIFTFQYVGDEILEADDKVLGREGFLMREFEAWNERSARLFAADCAERVLHFFEAKHPNDMRPREAIEAARQFARGEIDAAALLMAWVAAWVAAWEAAESTVGVSARSAARAVARSAVGLAAWDTAQSTARGAAQLAAESAAAERAWQTERLFDYLEGRITCS